MNIIGKKYIYFIISLLIIIPGSVSLFLYGLKPSIDFVGGSRIEIQNPKFTSIQTNTEELVSSLKDQGVDVHSIQKAGEMGIILRTKPLDPKTHVKVIAEIQKKYPKTKEVSFQTIGPIVGAETTMNAVKAVVVASILIVLYIAFSFRKVPKPASSWRFGICAIIALLHDVLVVMGIFSLLGKILNVEIDSLFVTAILTIIGFSVHDTIVVFDRIRENLLKGGEGTFEQIVNDSILQTLGRSLNTSLTVLLVLFTLILFGGGSTKWFIVALFVGVASGTYSSIFNAAPLLVVWEEWNKRRKRS